MKKACNAKDRAGMKAAIKKINKIKDKRKKALKLTAEELIQWIMESGLTTADIITAARSHGIELKFSIEPNEDKPGLGENADDMLEYEATKDNNDWMNAPTGKYEDDWEDNINPAHYQDGGIETIDFLEAKSTPEEFEGYCKLNAMKYLSRAGKKRDTSAIEDKQKAVWYLNKSIAVNRRQHESN